MKEKDTDILRDAVTDVLTLREVAKENAMDHLREAFTPKLRQVIADQLRQEAEDDEEMEANAEEEEGDEEEVEVELELDDDDDEEADDDEEEEEDDEEEMEDMEDMSDEEIEEIANFLYGVDEAVADDDRHSDPDQTDRLSYDEPQHDGGHEEAPMLDMGGHEDGYTGPSVDDIHEKLNLDKVLAELEDDMEDEDIEEALRSYIREMDHEDEEEMKEGDYDYEEEDMEDMDESQEIDIDALLSEYGVTDVTRDPMEDPVDLSGPYDDLVDDLMDTSDNYTDADYGSGFGRMDYDAETMPDGSAINESVSLRGLLREMEEEEEEMEMDKNMAESSKRKLRKLRRENEELQERLGEYREVLNTLRKQVNEVNLVNSKLLYTNKLNNAFKLNTRQNKRIVDAFDRAQNLREVKLTYANLAENFSDNYESGSQQKSRQSSSVNSLTESLDRSLSDTSSTKPQNSQILNENTEFSERMKKLAGLN